MNVFEKIKEKCLKNSKIGRSSFAEFIKILDEVEKEHNNGWIPCSERLPEEGGHYLVTYHEWSNGDYLPKFNDIHVRRMHYQASDHFTGWNYPKYVDENAEKDTSKEVIAWQLLPEPYKESEQY